ncbi:MAG: BBE domain-containing protein, partial [Silvibacterium sp.]
FEKLPVAPREVAEASVYFAWKDMTEDRFTRLVSAYGDYWEGRGQDSDTWGLFSLLEIAPQSRGHFGIYSQFCQPDGTAADLSVLNEFLETFAPFSPDAPPVGRRGPIVPGIFRSGRRVNAGRNQASGQYEVVIRPWLDATIGDGGSGAPGRAKYKSAYMKRSFTPAEASTIYRFYASNELGARDSVVSIDSYGGAINRPRLARETSIAQRSSVMKLQWQCYWQDAAEDDDHLRSLDKFFTAVYTGSHVDAQHQGTPWGERYEGCYMNYPDSDMLRYPYWPELFYGRDGLYKFLQQVKRRYDPNNVFHSSMSVQE